MLTNSPFPEKTDKKWPVPNWIPHQASSDCGQSIARAEKMMMREGGKCIYCELDLVSSTELLLSAELDHLVPKEVFRNAATVGYTKDGDYLANLVFCCGPCNDAKGNWPLCLPEVEARHMLEAANRVDYIKAATHYTVTRRRSEEKKLARLMSKVWSQRATKLGAHAK